MHPAREKIRDFHLHTHHSDGLYPPGVLIERAARQGVAECAITDHDTLAGIAEGELSAKRMGISFIPGVELTTFYGKREVHILAYGFTNPGNHASSGGFTNPGVYSNPDNHTNSGGSSSNGLAAYLGEIKRSRDEWLRQVVELSQREPIMVGGNGKRALTLTRSDAERFRHAVPNRFQLSLLAKEKLEALCPEFRAVPARHIMYLLFWGRMPQYVNRYEELLARCGIDSRIHWELEALEQRATRPAREVLDMLRGERALAAVAHPGEMGLGREDLAVLRDMGARGIEVYTPKHNAEQTEYFETIAKELGMFAVAGTDYHDQYSRMETEMGRGRAGNVLTRGITVSEIRAYCESIPSG